MANQIFSLANATALVAWALLIFLPRRRWATAVAGGVVPVALALSYAAIVATSWGGSSGGFSSLPAVAELFGHQWLLLAGWIHYLAFDLLVGSWEVRDAQARRIPHLAVVPCLVLTFLFGPAGWLLYRALGLMYPEGAAASASRAARVLSP
ncbi:MAG TPA: ABA4-like family protein [Vicinamibacterales bacterium]|nr:ABA4-like family protein [Vicinamibacterales bacterium]